MTKCQIKNLSYSEKVKLSNKRYQSGSYTAEALVAQELLWEDRWDSIQIINEPNPFDYEPFSMEEY